MDVASVAIVVAALGVSFGWQPSQEDPHAYEVVMQVEPELVDVLHDGNQNGRQIPIESHVPASVTPIRNIRVVVGTNELPRTPIASKNAAKSSTDRVVRGQEPSPVEHTARFQSDNGWGGDRYAPATTAGNRQFDQRGATIGGEPVRTAQASPWTLDSAQQSATDAGNSLRNSVNSGVQQTQQQFTQGSQQMLDSAQNSVQSAGGDFGHQLQNASGFGGQTSPPATASMARAPQSGWPAPPPLATSSANRTTTPAAWSSMQPELAPPRLAPPPLAGGVRVASNPAMTRSGTGPSFPPPPSTAPLHSVLTDPSKSSSQTAEQDWSSVWGTGTSNSASDADAGIGLVPVPPRPRTSAVSNQTQAPPAAWPTSPATPATVTANSMPSQQPGTNRYDQTAPPASSSNLAADEWANFGRSANDRPNNATQAQAPAAMNPPTTPIAQQGSFTQPAIGMQPPAGQPSQQAANGEELPWKPLLAVSLALAGSLGANLFLGWSYADARHRYRALVAKTTHSFQKAAGIAA